MAQEEELTRRYDEVLAEQPDGGMKHHDALAETLLRLDLSDTSIEVPARTVLVEAWADTVLRRRNKSNRAKMLRDKGYLDELRTAITRETLLGEIDPILDTPIPVGDGDGTIRLLRYWTVVDLQSLRKAIDDNRKRINQTADDEIAKIDRWLSDLRARDARTIGDLYG